MGSSISLQMIVEASWRSASALMQIKKTTHLFDITARCQFLWLFTCSAAGGSYWASWRINFGTIRMRSESANSASITAVFTRRDGLWQQVNRSIFVDVHVSFANDLVKVSRACYNTKSLKKRHRPAVTEKKNRWKVKFCSGGSSCQWFCVFPIGEFMLSARRVSEIVTSVLCRSSIKHVRCSSHEVLQNQRYSSRTNSNRSRVYCRCATGGIVWLTSLSS